MNETLALVGGLSFDEVGHYLILDVLVAIFAFGGMFLINHMDKHR